MPPPGLRQMLIELLTGYYVEVTLNRDNKTCVLKPGLKEQSVHCGTPAIASVQQR